MKKQIRKNRLLPALFLAFLVLFAMTAAAENKQKVSDEAHLLTETEKNKLQSQFEAIAETYQIDIIAATADSCGTKTPQAYTDDFYDQYTYGYGEDQDGIILMICMKERKFHLATRGNAILIFTDYGLEYIDDQITPELSDGDYYEAFRHFGTLAEEFIKEYEASGEAFDINYTYHEKMDIRMRMLLAFGIGVLAACIVTGILVYQLKSVAPERRAQEYVRDGSFQVTGHRDIFLYRTVNRRKIEKPSNTGGSGGSSTHRTSGGGTAGGRTGSF